MCSFARRSAAFVLAVVLVLPGGVACARPDPGPPAPAARSAARGVDAADTGPQTDAEPTPRAVGRAGVAPVGGVVVRPFDPPVTPYGPGHRGVDLAARPGTPVRASLPGVVRFAGPVAGRRWVSVEHGPDLTTTYGGVAPTVRAGDRVATGAVLGRATGRHLDWGARRRGVYIDPLGLLGGWRVRLVPLR